MTAIAILLFSPVPANFCSGRVESPICYKVHRMQEKFTLEKKTKKHLGLQMWRMPKMIFFKKELLHTSCAVT